MQPTERSRRPSEEEALPGRAETWLQISDGLIAGIQHELNNRLASLSAIAQVLEIEISEEHPLAGALEMELDRWQASTELLHLLNDSGPAEPILLGEVLEGAQRLLRIHHEVRNVEVEIEESPEPQPLLIPRSELLRIWMMMLIPIARLARQQERPIRIRVTGEEEYVRWTIRASVDTDPAGGCAEASPALPLDPLRSALAEWQGTLSWRQGDGTIELAATLPTLQELRRRRSPS